MKLFLSHSSRDSQLTNRIYDWVQSQSYVDEIWIDRIKLKTGDYLLNKLDEEITTSNYLIPVLTKNSIISRWVKYEIKKALSEETEKNIKVLPVIIKEPSILDEFEYHFMSIVLFWAKNIVSITIQNL